MTHRRFTWNQFFVHLWLALMVIGALYPMYFLLNMSREKHGADELRHLPHHDCRSSGPTTRHFVRPVLALHVEYDRRDVLLSGLPMLVFASLTAYVLARYKFPGHNLFFMALLGLMMIPGILTLIPGSCGSCS